MKRTGKLLISRSLALFVGLVFSFSVFFTPTSFAFDDNAVNYLNLSDHFGPSGVPIGGIGVGCFDMAPDGSFTRIRLNNIHSIGTLDNYWANEKGFFLAMWENGSSARRLQRATNTLNGMNGFAHSTFTGLFPTANVSFSDTASGTPKTQVKVNAYSGLVPQNVKDSSLPVAWLEVELTNPQASPVQVSAALSWEDVISRGIKDPASLNDVSSDNMANNGDNWPYLSSVNTSVDNYSSGSFAGLRQYANTAIVPKKWTFQNYNNQVAILAESQGTGSVSVLPVYDPTNGSSAWSPFVSSGAFGTLSGPTSLSTGSGAAKASAVAVKVTLAAGETRKLRFMVSWWMDEPQVNRNGDSRSFFGTADYSRYYHNYFSNLGSLVSYAISNRDPIYTQTKAWQQPILDSNLPDWLKFKEINSGCTLYTNTVLNKGGCFSCIEGQMGGAGGTMDQKMSSHPVYQKFFTQLDNAENNLFSANRIPDGSDLNAIPHYIIQLYTGIANFDGTNPIKYGCMLDNTGAWVIQLAKYYDQTGDLTYIQNNWTNLKNAMAWAKSKIQDSSGIPVAATTFDDTSHPTIFNFAGSVYLSMLKAAAHLGQVMGDTAFVTICNTQYTQTSAGMNNLWVENMYGKYYKFGTALNGGDFSGKNEYMFTGQLGGQFMNRYCGWGDVLPFDKSTNSILTQLTTVVQRAPLGDYYADKTWDYVNNVSRDSSGSRCWPFYLESYTAMGAIQSGYVADGLEVMRHIQLVHLRKGFTWEQNLWMPQCANYMTTPVTWFVNDVLAGAALDIPNHTLTLGPVAIPGDNKLVLPLYFPKFWAKLEYYTANSTAKLTIIKKFGTDNIYLNKIIGMPVGVASSAQKSVTIPDFTVAEGAVLDLTPYFSTISGSVSKPAVLTGTFQYGGTPIYPVIGSGTGLKGEYFSDNNLNTLKLIRVDPTVNFDWGAGAPDPSIGSDNFSVRWSGNVSPEYSQPYKFYTKTDDGVRLWVNGQLLIDHWVAGGVATEYESAPIDLVAGQSYPIKMEYFDGAGAASAQLSWWSTTQVKGIIPQTQLYPPATVNQTIEAENYSGQSGIQTEGCSEGGSNVAYIENGDWVSYSNFDFGTGATSFEARVASNASGGNIEIRLDSLTGTLIGTCPVAGTGSWQTWVTKSCSVSGASGVHNLYLKFTGGSGYLFNVNWFKFTGGGATPTPTPTPALTSTPTPTPVSTPTPTPTPGGSTKYEAENATLAGGCSTNTNHANYSGAAFVDGYDLHIGASATFTVTAATTGSINITLRYSAGMGTQTMAIYVNGTKIKDSSLTGTANWDTWADKVETMTLNAGTNTIKYQAEVNCCANIDYIIVPIKYEAENATLAGGCSTNTNHANYSGAAFVDGYNLHIGASTTFSVTAAAAGSRNITLRYSAGAGTQTMAIYVNGTKIKDSSLTGTGNWDTWADKVEALTLNAGTNTIKYQADVNACINIDYITVP
jgi:non-lysosomal glucosylceramidase